MENLKDSFRKLEKYIISVDKIWNRPEYVSISVLVQNLYAQDDLTEQYCNDVLVAIGNLNEYLGKQDHVVATVYEHLGMDIQGHFMNEQIDKIEN